MASLSSSHSTVDRSPLSAFKPGHSRSNSTGSSWHSRQNSRDWEVMTDIQPNLVVQDINSVPGICEGFLMKKRKYPLQGWHKRYFVLEKGIIRYAKTQQDLTRGKNHGSLDVSRAVMSVNKKSRRIDLDVGDNLYHLKAKSQDIFFIWMTKLSAHRIYKKNEAMTIHHGVLQALSSGSSSTLPAMAHLAQRNRTMMDQYQSSTSIYQPCSPSLASSQVNSKVSAWLQQTQQANICQQELSRCEVDLGELGHLIQTLHLLEEDLPITDRDLERRISMQNLALEKPKKKTKVWGHNRTLSHGMLSVNNLGSSKSSSGLGASLQSIPDYVYTQLSTPGCASPEGKKLQQNIYTVSQRVHASLKHIHELLVLERERLTQAWNGPDLRQSTSDQLASLCSTLSELELQSRLTKVHSVSLSSDSTEESFCTVRQDQPQCHETRSRLSVAESTAEYFDAHEVIVSESLSENEASDESGLSDTTASNYEPEEAHALVSLGLKYRASVSRSPDVPSSIPIETGRRKVLPAHCADNSHIGILSILYNNIGKDLSRVSMPAALNEPLNFLQRVSEELEYSELLDIANRTDDPYQRMVYVAVFSISGYAWASWRNRYKPFNPVLGETYESIREDRGFRYVAEQVSHHPPVCACHAESENFMFWQDQRWKNKFWGKSVEIVSTGMVNVTLPRYEDHYEWNKAVTCIHNVFSQQRWLEHYGDVVIRNLKNDVCTCKMTFIKSRYGPGENKNEVQGVVMDQGGNVVHRFGGSWHEGIFCDTLPSPQCIWKPNPQPEDHFEYYGFSRYARELNELTPELRAVLPPTDTRFRPDQRILEEGKVAEADKIKDEVEEKQRERRKELAKRGEAHIPRFFRKTMDSTTREVWVTNGTYWKVRESPGFAKTENLILWRS